MRGLLLLFFSPVAFGADVGSPVPQPTGDANADIARIVSYLEKSEARAADLSARLTALEAKVAAVKPAAPPAPAPSVGVTTSPPFGGAILAPSAVTFLPPAPAPGSFAVIPEPVTYTSAPVTVRYGSTSRGGPLGLGILPALFGGCGAGAGAGGCGGFSSTAGYTTSYTVGSPTYYTVGGCASGQCGIAP